MRHLFGKDKLLRSSLVVMAIRVLGIFLGLAASVVLARGLGPDQYGIYAFALSLLTVLAMPVQLGLPTLAVRETAKAHATEAWGAMIGLWRWNSVIICASSLVVFALATVVYVARPDLLPPSTEKTIFVALALVPVIAFTAVGGSVLCGLKHPVRGMIPETLVRPLLVLILFGGWHQFGPVNPNALSAMIVYALASASALASCYYFFWSARPATTRERVTATYAHRAWFRAIVPLSLMVGLQAINHNTDLLMLGTFLEPAKVAEYRVALSIATLAVFGLIAIEMVVQPKIAELHTHGNLSGLQSLLGLSALGCLAVTAPIFAVTFLFADDLLPVVYGPEYALAYTPLIILMFAQTLRTLFGPVGSLLSMTGLERKSVTGLIIAALVNVVLNAVLIPIFGTAGAATATGLSLLTWNVAYWQFGKKALAVDSSVVGFFMKSQHLPIAKSG